MEFFNNKENDILKFKINSEGINVNNIEPRLILMTNENNNYLLLGKIDGDICRFEIPELNLYEKGDNGKIKFEIISEDLYFKVWEDNFEIKTKANVKIEEMISEIQKSSKPSISISEAKMETKPIIEKREEKKEEKVVESKKVEIKPEKVEEEKVNTTLSKLESIFENSQQHIVIEDEEEKLEEKVKVKTKKIDKQSEPIMKFDSFK